jgi:hypothetical protein
MSNINEPYSATITTGMPTNGYRKLECRIIKETEKAILVDNDDTGQEWFPLSTVNYIRRDVADNCDAIEFPDVIHAADWILKKKGI